MHSAKLGQCTQCTVHEGAFCSLCTECTVLSNLYAFLSLRQCIVHCVWCGRRPVKPRPHCTRQGHCQRFSSPTHLSHIKKGPQHPRRGPAHKKGTSTPETGDVPHIKKGPQHPRRGPAHKKGTSTPETGVEPATLDLGGQRSIH